MLKHYIVNAHSITDCAESQYHEGETIALDENGPENKDGRMTIWLRSGAIAPVSAPRVASLPAPAPTHTTPEAVKKE